MAEYRQNTPYEEIEKSDSNDSNENHGNTSLPFGLCKRYGIPLPKDATPRQAWDALKEKHGITPEQGYAMVDKRKQQSAESNNNRLDTIKLADIPDGEEKNFVIACGNLFRRICEGI